MICGEAEEGRARQRIEAPGSEMILEDCQQGICGKDSGSTDRNG